MLTSTLPTIFFLIFFNDTATTEIYPLSLHDALPISEGGHRAAALRQPSDLRPLDRRIQLCQQGPAHHIPDRRADAGIHERHQDRKSTRLNSSHLVISYAVFCLKKKNTITR